MATATAPIATEGRHVAAATRRNRLWSLLFWLTTLATAVPLIAIRHPPFTDLPEHVAAVATLAKLLPGGGGAPYVVAFDSSQYFLYHAAGAVLARIFGDAILAHGILLAATSMLWPLSLRALLRALGRDERLAIFGCMLVYNRALAIGFLPFVASVPVALFALALLVRQLARPAIPRALGLGALAVALFYTHVSSFLLFALIAVVMIAVRLPSGARAGMLGAAMPLAPSAFAAARWLHAGSLDGSSQIERVSRLPLDTMVSALPVWTFELWRSHIDEACAVIWWSAFAVLLAIGLRREVRAPGAFAFIPFASAALVYVLTPLRLGVAGFLNLRLAPILALFAVLGLRPRKGLAGDLPIAAAALAAVLMAGNAAFEMHRLEREVVGDLDALLAHARPGSRLAMLNFERGSRRMPFWPYVFAGSYHRANGGVVAGYSFTEMSHWPLHYAPGTAPPVHEPFWVYTPCSYRYRQDGDYYDYVLVQGKFDPFAGPTPGPTFSPIAKSRAFTLFAKSTGDRDDIEPDRGPCPTR